MNENEFLEIINLKLNYSKKKKITFEDFISEEWMSGGICGSSSASFWNDFTSITPKESDPEPDFHDLDIILEAIDPNITYLEYKKLINNLKIERIRKEIYGYYGESTIHTTKRFKIKNLYLALREKCQK